MTTEGASRLDVRVRRAGSGAGADAGAGAPVGTDAEDWLADEVPVALVFNGISHAVMLATPLDLEDFALGFALTEGLLDAPSALFGVEVVDDPAGLRVEMEVSSASFARLKEHRRTLAGRTGCGLCGTESLEQVEPPMRPLGDAARRHPVDPAAIAAALRAIPDHQPLQRRTGATHAAAWCAPDGRIVAAREDVGRHNALDKLVGALARAGIDPGQDGGFACITSRASVEMVRKAVMAGMGTLVAVSAPTARAVRTARDAGLALAGFARGESLVLYAGVPRFQTAASSRAASRSPNPEDPR